MSINRGNFAGNILDNIQASVIRHLTYLQCGKIALSKAICKDSGDDSWCGANDVAIEILEQVTSNPIKFRRCGRIDGVFLSGNLFRPIECNLDENERMIYQAALNTLEIQMRGIYDTKEII